jgi:hypothetical protein
MLLVFFVLFAFHYNNSEIATLRAEQSMRLSQLGLTSISPENLPRAAETLRKSVPVQDARFPIDDLTRLPAWATSKDTLTAYADRLKLMDAQSQELDKILQQRARWTSLGTLGVSVVALLLLFGQFTWGRKQI